MRNIVVVRGGGEVASSIVHRMHNVGYPVVILETAQPSAIHREVSFSEAVYDREQLIERVLCRRAESYSQAKEIMKSGNVALLVDPAGKNIPHLKPLVVVDATMAKKNLGTNRDMAKFTVAVGQGFCAGKDVNCVIETRKGHNFGRIIYEGRTMREPAEPSTVGDVICSPATGRIENERTIASRVKRGEVISHIYTRDGGVVEVKAPSDGVICGLIRDGYEVTKGLRILDIADDTDQDNCFLFSGRDRCISGSVLEAVKAWEKRQHKPGRFFGRIRR